MKASKLVYNKNDYFSVSGFAQVGVEFVIDNKKKFFGFEEWNNNDIFKNLKIGYLDSFRARKIENKIDLVSMFSYNAKHKKVYLIGYMKNVRQLESNEIDVIKKLLEEVNWLNSIQDDFQNVSDNNTGFEKFKKCFNSKEIITKTENSFVVNLKYEEIKILKNSINLTEIFPNINNLKRLSVLYNLPIEIQNFILNKCK